MLLANKFDTNLIQQQKILKNNPILKIVYNKGTPPFKFTNKNNQPDGMMIDIWKLWSKKNNINIKFIEAPWKDTIEMIKDGRADIHAGIYHTEKRDKFLDYTSKSFFDNTNHFFYHSHISRDNIKNQLQANVIGISNGYPRQFMSKSFSNLFVKLYQSTDELNSAFINGDIQVMLASKTALMYYMKHKNINKKSYSYSDATYAYTKKYFGAIKKGNKKLLNLINKGFKLISNKELESIQKKWTSDLKNNQINYINKESLLTEEEKQYLKNKKELTICAKPNLLPYEAVVNGKFIGISADYLNLISHKLNIPLSILPIQKNNDIFDLLKNKKCDIKSIIVKNKIPIPYRATETYIKDHISLVTNIKEPFIKNLNDYIDKTFVIVSSQHGVGMHIKHKYPNMNLMIVDNINEALKIVLKGEAFGFIGQSLSSIHTIQKNYSTKLKVMNEFKKNDLAIGVVDTDVILLNILNKTLASISETDKIKIRNSWKITTIHKEANYTIFWYVLIFLSMSSLIIIYLNYKLKFLVSKRTDEINRQKESFKTLFEDSSDGLLLIQNNIYVECNKSIVKLFGFDIKNDILNSHPWTLSPKYQPDGELSSVKGEGIIKKCLNKDFRGFIEFEWLNTKVDGTHFWCNVVLNKIDLNGIDTLYARVRNIDKEKYLEQQSKLIEYQSKTATLGRLISMIAHQWRQPLSLINAITSDIYHRADSSDQVKKDLLEIEDVTQNLSTSISNIHNFYAPNKKIKNNSVIKIIHECIDILFPPISKSLKPQFIIKDRDVLKLNGYTSGLQQTIITILNNSLDIFEKRHIEKPIITIELYKKDKYNYITIEDNGGGIDKESLDKIFDIYFTTTTTTTTRGFGLSIAKDIVENNLKGTLDVSNSPHGAKFTIRYI